MIPSENISNPDSKAGPSLAPNTGVVLMNVGTPEAPTKPAVRRYLREFLSDPYVIDINPIARFLLVHCVILPFRTGKSTKAYQSIWTEEGSPLLVHGRNLTERLEKALGVPVELAMRYQSPSLETASAQLLERGVEKVIGVPLFPHFAKATWESSADVAHEIMGPLFGEENIRLVQPFYEHPDFIHAVTEITQETIADFDPELVMMSFHGLPMNQCMETDKTGSHCGRSDNCCDAIVEANSNCYRAQCFATARALAQSMNLVEANSEEQREPGQYPYEVAFQSRLGRTQWTEPYTEPRLEQLAESGVRRVAVFCPSFVADCIETIAEIEDCAADTFKAHGGEELRFIPCLNDTDVWVQALARIIQDSA
ncbi:MAG: ferrochelatase [Myxococcales bacterium]|nr:ferrochelatase [Myxococcales bacterium]